ncbi:hypothetical protein A1O3_06172 [Capronia epimyces CBS 606.96]|uniref:Uncharacterized protein n=1 Tax=Capronia epimyces CBS 606.96 TaxID=1182542 RepID=W9YJD3_9EURO|nr:uncharacterized protein A1O3_06172 [Capronia epimyces CBS 606.96]EXJ82359.1 hypothetical protein A1O3_06172 [Capronia epimyces CBS 606.96]
MAMSPQAQLSTTSTKGLSEQDLATIQRSEAEQINFQKTVATSKSYSATEKTAFSLSSAQEFHDFWEQTIQAKGEFDDSHEQGCGLRVWARQYQNAASVVQSFMKDFSPIIDVVRDCAGPYGGLAVGTISVLFAVAANKDAMESSLTDAIIEINDRLPGLDLYRHIYNDRHELDIRLQGRIVAAYQMFIEFCIGATQYYKRAGVRRWLKAMGWPNDLVDKATRVRKVILDIRRLCDELLDKNVHMIKQLNLDQKAEIQNLQGEIKQLLEAQDNHILSHIQRALNLSDYSSERQHQQLEQYRRALASDDHLNAPYFEQMRGKRLDALRADSGYQSWSNSDGPSLLILSGHNESSINYLDRCWVSPVATAMISDLFQATSGGTENLVYGYYVFHSKDDLYRSISAVLLQLLRKKSVVLRKKSQWDELRAALSNLEACKPVANHNHATSGTGDARRLAAFEHVVHRVIGLFDDSETIHIVLDRLDQCCDLVEKVDQRKLLLKLLAKLVESARCRLKILVVNNGDQWNVERRISELGQTIQGRVILHTAVQQMRE